jgi:hypothetical protein
MELQSVVGTSCASPEWTIHIVPDNILGGQPARGTELFSLQLRNTIYGLRRNIFLENGLVSFVTCYHKGYNISGSTKIIHRYLPEAVSEL